MVTLHIPQDIYYNAETANFYHRSGKGMGVAFWQEWRHLSHYFPTSANNFKETGE